MTDIEYDALVDDYRTALDALIHDFRTRGLETGDLLDAVERTSNALVTTLEWEDVSARRERQMGRQAT